MNFLLNLIIICLGLCPDLEILNIFVLKIRQSQKAKSESSVSLQAVVLLVAQHQNYKRPLGIST